MEGGCLLERSPHHLPHFDPQPVFPRRSLGSARPARTLVAAANGFEVHTMEGPSQSRREGNQLHGPREGGQGAAKIRHKSHRRTHNKGPLAGEGAAGPAALHKQSHLTV